MFLLPLGGEGSDAHDIQYRYESPHTLMQLLLIDIIPMLTYEVKTDKHNSFSRGVGQISTTKVGKKTPEYLLPVGYTLRITP
jgi:hypothetical protein